jgi:hypothetical protein
MVIMTVSEYEKGIELLKLGPEYDAAFERHFREVVKSARAEALFFGVSEPEEVDEKLAAWASISQIETSYADSDEAEFYRYGISLLKIAAMIGGLLFLVDKVIG